MTAISPAQTQPSLPIAAVERETGLAKDTLRVWEKRYGFPRPVRDIHGNRTYPLEQVQQLRVIRRLLDMGLRPGKVVALDRQALDDLLQRHVVEAPGLSRTKPHNPRRIPSVGLSPMLDAIARHDPVGLRQLLHHALARLGLAAFVMELVAPLTTAVGDAWAQGRFEIFEEHLYTEAATSVLHQSIASLSFPAGTSSGLPRVLLTTMPGEPHGLGLLMVEAILTLEGCTCVSLGTQTPLIDIVHASRAHQADVIALSFTAVQPSAMVMSGLTDLRRRLDSDVSLWVGGSCTALYENAIDGVTATSLLTELASLIAQWRQAHPRA